MNLIPIEDAVINLNDVADKLKLGPQAELLEEIESFNNRYGRNKEIIAINKKFGFKPGTYDKVKEVHANYILKYSSKPSSMYALKERILNNRWTESRFWDHAIRIQNKMQNLKYRAVDWQDNTELLKTFWDNFIERIINESGQVINNIPNTVVDVLVDNDDIADSDRWLEMKIYLDVHVNNIDLVVYKMDDIISKFKWGDVHLRWTIPIWKFINAWCTYANDNVGFPPRQVHNPIAKLHPRYSYLEHPYVTGHRSRYSNEFDDDFRYNTCTGDVQSAINNAAWAINPHAIAILSRQWLSKYHIPHTNPLNRIDKCHYGFPLNSDPDMLINKTINQAQSDCDWNRHYATSIKRCLDSKDRLKSDLEWRLEYYNACNNCQFKDEYAYLKSNSSIPSDAEYDGQEVVVIDTCSKQIIDYIGPQTEEESILEACRIQLLIRYYMLSFQEAFKEEGYSDILLNNEFLNISLDIIIEVLGEVYLEYGMINISNSYSHFDLESFLDEVFGTRVWDALIEELTDVMNEYSPPEEGLWEYEHVEDEWHGSTLGEIRNEINRIQNPVIEQWNPETIAEETLTPEERAIRWATSRGSAINI